MRADDHAPPVRSSDLPPGAGRSSFELIDARALLRGLPLAAGSSFLDVACGKGLYTLAAREIVGETGSLIAFDLWEEGIAWLRREAVRRGYGNIHAFVADAGRPLPVPTNSVDVALLAMVLHDLVESGRERGALEELERVIRPGGSLAVLEFKKVEPPPGPPLHVRITAEEVARVVTACGFRRTALAEPSVPTYLMGFVRV